MNLIDFPIERINEFLKDHVFEVITQPTHDENHNVKTNVKVKLTGVKNYISIGESKPHVEYTLYILDGDKESNMWNSMYAKVYGTDVRLTTTTQVYYQLVWVMNQLLSNFLLYFGVNKNALCTRVINEVEPMKLNEGVINEGILDKTTRRLVRDIISFFKHQRSGDFSLPEDLSYDDSVYYLPGLDGFTVSLKLVSDEDIDGIDVDGDLYYDDDEIEITIVSNPKHGYTMLDELTKELNDVIRHELEHIKQIDGGYKMPSKEPKSPEKYYTQPHELEAQRAGFRKRGKSEKLDFETVVRNWFETNSHKHRLNPEQKERVIQKILSQK